MSASAAATKKWSRSRCCFIHTPIVVSEMFGLPRYGYSTRFASSELARVLMADLGL
jgi:hypothetical protein